MEVRVSGGKIEPSLGGNLLTLQSPLLQDM